MTKLSFEKSGINIIMYLVLGTIILNSSIEYSHDNESTLYTLISNIKTTILKPVNWVLSKISEEFVLPSSTKNTKCITEYERKRILQKENMTKNYNIVFNTMSKMLFDVLILVIVLYMFYYIFIMFDLLDEDSKKYFLNFLNTIFTKYVVVYVLVYGCVLLFIYFFINFS